MSRIVRNLTIAVAATMAVALTGMTIAEAKTSRGVRQLVVKKRPFTDSGRVVPIGSESHYVHDGSLPGRSVDYYSSRGRYGAETLPGSFGVFGN